MAVFFSPLYTRKRSDRLRWIRIRIIGKNNRTRGEEVKFGPWNFGQAISALLYLPLSWNIGKLTVALDVKNDNGLENPWVSEYPRKCLIKLPCIALQGIVQRGGHQCPYSVRMEADMCWRCHVYAGRPLYICLPTRRVGCKVGGQSGVSTHNRRKPLKVFQEDLVLRFRFDLRVVFPSARDTIEVSLDIRGELGVNRCIVI